MKRISQILLVILSVAFFTGCEQSDDYYLDYDKTSISYEGTIYDYLKHKPGVYDSLILVLERLPDLKAKLNDESKGYTYFAVNNRSFELAIANLNTVRESEGQQPLYLEDIQLNILDSIANRYLIEEEISIELIKPYLDGYSVKSSKYDYGMHAQYRVLTASGIVGGGEQQIIFSDVNSSIYQRYWQSANTKSVDLKTKNGLLHTLSSQHDFAFGKLNKYLTKSK